MNDQIIITGQSKEGKTNCTMCDAEGETQVIKNPSKGISTEFPESIDAETNISLCQGPWLTLQSLIKQGPL